MAEKSTPDGKSLVLLRRQAERERLLAEARREERPSTPPEWDDNEEPSVTIKGRPEDVRLLLKPSPVPPSGPVSIRARAGKALESRLGKTVAAVVMAVISAAAAALAQALAK